jgi:hypothetical protein
MGGIYSPAVAPPSVYLGAPETLLALRASVRKQEGGRGGGREGRREGGREGRREGGEGATGSGCLCACVCVHTFARCW